MSLRIINRGRGPEIEGTRITVYRILDLVRESASADCIARELDLSKEEVQAGLTYIDQNREVVEREYESILARVRRRNPPSVEAGRAKSLDELRERIQAKPTQNVAHAAGRG